MALQVDILRVLQDGAKAGANAASTAGRDLTDDITKFVIPHLEDIAVQVASIVAKRQANVYTDQTAKALLNSETDAIQTLVETVVTLTVLEVQTIVNSIISALSEAITTLLGFAL